MARRNRIGLTFSGLDELATRIDQVGGNLKATTERALKASFDYVTPNLETDINRHVDTGVTKRSLRKTPEIEWEGHTANIKVGFDIRHGGLPSIFLMYGTPRTKKDTKLYNDIYGNRTKQKIAEIQKEIFNDEIRRVMG